MGVYMERKIVERAEQRLLHLFGFLPRGLVRELSQISRSVPCFCTRLSELRLRRGGPSQIVISGRSYPLFYRPRADEMEHILLRLSEGALFAHRDSIGDGYISAGMGIRVGVSGRASYEGGVMVGVGDISLFVFRLPSVRCDYAEELYRGWASLGFGNLLIGAPPLGGKTTAIAALARLLGSGRDAMRTVIVDERAELDPAEFAGCTVDVLQGYKRQAGIELAIRTMSAELVIVDEITSEKEANALFVALGAGVGVVATVHAGSVREMMMRGCLGAVLREGLFRVGAMLTSAGGTYGFSLFEIEREYAALAHGVL